jgi:hypothetical protein
VPKVNTDYSFKGSHDEKFGTRMEKDLRRRIKGQMQAEQVLQQRKALLLKNIDDKELRFQPSINEVSKNLPARTYEDFANWQESRTKKVDEIRKSRQEKCEFKPKLSENAQKIDKNKLKCIRVNQNIIKVRNNQKIKEDHDRDLTFSPMLNPRSKSLLKNSSRKSILDESRGSIHRRNSDSKSRKKLSQKMLDPLLPRNPCEDFGSMSKSGSKGALQGSKSQFKGDRLGPGLWGKEKSMTFKRGPNTAAV